MIVGVRGVGRADERALTSASGPTAGCLRCDARPANGLDYGLKKMTTSDDVMRKLDHLQESVGELAVAAAKTQTEVAGLRERLDNLARPCDTLRRHLDEHDQEESRRFRIWLLVGGVFLGQAAASLVAMWRLIGR